MTSVHLFLEPTLESYPLARKENQLGRFGRVICRYCLEDGDLVMHKCHRAWHWVYAAFRHPLVPGQRLTAQDDALVGFGWGHGAAQ